MDACGNLVACLYCVIADDAFEFGFGFGDEGR